MKLINTKIPYHGETDKIIGWVVPIAKILLYVSASYGLAGPLSWYFGWLAPKPEFEAFVPMVSGITLAIFTCAVLIIVWVIWHNARIETERNKTS